MQTAQQLWLRVNGAIAVIRLLACLDVGLESSAGWDESDDKLLSGRFWYVDLTAIDALIILAKIGVSGLKQTT